MFHPSLHALVSPQKASDVRAQLMAGEAVLIERADQTGELSALPFLQSLETLLQTWPYPVEAHLPKVADEASAIEVSAADATALFENGMGLMFDHAERFSPVLTRWLETIRQDLGFSALTQSRCLLYATPDGKGTAAHFDQNTNFVLQLHGTKTWWIAPTEHVQNPLSRFTIGLPADPELATYIRHPLPEKMPATARPVVLKPGSVLVVPPALWHCTQAEGDALSLNFTYHAPAWLDLLTSALRAQLALSPEWRAPADPAHPEDLQALLAELSEIFPHLTASDIVNATEL